MSHKVVRNICRPDPAHIKILGEMGVATVHEAQGRTGLMRPHMRPIFAGGRIAGPAITVSCQPGDNLMIHAAVEVCRRGDVMVVAPTSESTDGMFGELLATSLLAHGVAALVIDAGVRDVAELTGMEFPVWSKAISAQGTVKASPGSVNIPVVCAGMLVNPGDVVVADQDGVAIVPAEKAAEVAELCVQRLAKEAKSRERLRNGELGVDFYGLRAKLAELGVQYIRQSGGIVPPALGFIGFGEAAYHLSKGLRGAGIAQIAAFDINTATPGRGEPIRSRAADAGVQLTATREALTSDSFVLMSAVTADQALIAAKQFAPHLTSAHLYADINSVSPAVKQSIGRAVEATGARFVEVAVMTAVRPHGHKVPMLTGGRAAADFARLLSPFGMKIEIGKAEVGTAAATKMCRSIMIKGLEALMTECILGATFYGVDERVIESLKETYPGIDWPKLATYLISRVVVHGERRAREMEEVAETLRAAGIDPLMTTATAELMDWSARMDFRGQFSGKDLTDYRDFAALNQELSKQPK